MEEATAGYKSTGQRAEGRTDTGQEIPFPLPVSHAPALSIDYGPAGRRYNAIDESVGTMAVLKDPIRRCRAPAILDRGVPRQISSTQAVHAARLPQPPHAIGPTHTTAAA